ncbi:Transposable element Tc3 transposase [Lucilia cuprina]|nr:Transposable element Tc3 transposase [Lucilia cuprina]
MNSEIHVEMLKDVLVNYLEDNLDNDMTFQQDTACIHIWRVSKAIFSSASIPILDWLAGSSDLNPKENIWGIM